MEIEYLLKELNIIRKEYEIVKKREEKFNIFSALHKEHDERRLHSRFISVLLQPKGKHGNGIKFLELFVSHTEFLDRFKCIESTVVFPKENDKKEDNNIDILILNQTNKQCIIIENKIYAGDSNTTSGGQLERYIKHAIDEKKIPKENIFVIYLSLDGHQPSKESIKGFEDFENIITYSYEELILPWINSCLTEVVSQPFLRESLIQYKKLIEKMTGNSASIEERKSYRELIGSSEDYMKSAKKLIDNFKHVKWHSVFNFWSDLQNRINNKYELIKPFDKDSINSKKTNECITDIAHYETYRKGQKEKQKCEILFKTIEEIIVKIKYSAMTDTFYFGIPKKENERFNNVTNILLEKYANEYMNNESKELLLYKVFNNNIQFNDFGKERTFDLINDSCNKESVTKAFEEIETLTKRIAENCQLVPCLQAG